MTYCRNMPDMSHESLELETLLDYEVRGSARYRRSMSLVMVVPVNSSIRLRELLGPVLRDSDELFELRSKAVILMGETDRDGALVAIRRYKGACGGEIDLLFALACFPDDGCNGRELLEAVCRRRDKALTLERGAVVVAG